MYCIVVKKLPYLCAVNKNYIRQKKINQKQNHGNHNRKYKSANAERRA